MPPSGPPPATASPTPVRADRRARRARPVLRSGMDLPLCCRGGPAPDVTTSALGRSLHAALRLARRARCARMRRLLRALRRRHALRESFDERQIELRQRLRQRLSRTSDRVVGIEIDSAFVGRACLVPQRIRARHRRLELIAGEANRTRLDARAVLDERLEYRAGLVLHP